MFEKFFGLSENPFRLTPDPKFLFLAEVHKEALSHLRYGIEQRMGFVLITGEVGTGKTTVCRELLKNLDSRVHTALILHPALSDVELLQSINAEFGLEAASSSKKALMDELFAFLLDVNARGENAVLIIDEGQNLDPAVLEQVRMLSNLETEQQKLLQILLVGQPELGVMLAANNLRQLSDRIVVRYHMGPLNQRETRDYIQHRLSVAGARGEVRFTWPALHAVYRYSGGLPRKINAVCERALLLACLKGAHSITAALVRQARREVQGFYGRRSGLRIWLAGLVCLAIVSAAGLIAGPQLFKAVAPRQPKAAAVASYQPQPAAPAANSWPVARYDQALTLLMRQPGCGSGRVALTLRPAPEVLTYIGRPFIAAVSGGYVVISRVDAAGVHVAQAGGNARLFDFKSFRRDYAWRVVLNYAGAESRFYKLNDAQPGVRAVQAKLRELGYIPFEPDGFYGIDTARAVERLQEVYGLRRDGVAGGETLALLKILEYR